MGIFLKLLLDTSGSMDARVDTGESLYVSLVKAAVVSIRECAQDLRADQTLCVGVDTFASQHQADVSALEFKGDETGSDMERKLAKCQEELLSVQVGGGTAYFDAGIASLQALHAKVGEGDKGFMIIVTDGQDTSSVCNQHPFQGQGRKKLKAAAAAVAGKVHLLVLGSDDLSHGARAALEEASQVSQPPVAAPPVAAPQLGRGRQSAFVPPATFSRSSSASVSRGFEAVARQVTQSMRADDEEEGGEASDFIMVDGDGSSGSSSTAARPALRVITNTHEPNAPPFTSIFSPIRPHVRRAATH